MGKGFRRCAAQDNFVKHKKKEEEYLPAFSSSSSEDSGSESDTHQSDSAKLSTVDSDSVEWSDEDAVSSDSATVGSLDTIESEEMNEANFFTKHDGTYDNAENIFTPAELDELKKRERIMIERNTKGYYRSKLKDRALYDQMMGEYKRFIQPKMLRQVNHMWNT